MKLQQNCCQIAMIILCQCQLEFFTTDLNYFDLFDYVIGHEEDPCIWHKIACVLVCVYIFCCQIYIGASNPILTKLHQNRDEIAMIKLLQHQWELLQYI